MAVSVSENISGERTLIYFVSDVHIGLQAFNPEERERRFVRFLRSIPAQRTSALYLLGDIWDFWYEWKHVVPKGYVQLFASLQNLMDAGVKVYFFQGNHDIWTYNYFEQMGMVPLSQPHFVTIGAKEFCIGHGDTLGKIKFGYRILHGIFTNRFTQWCFSNLLHPDWSMAFGNAWSRSNRLSRRENYRWKGEEENLYRYAAGVLQSRKVDFFIFGHLHVCVQEDLPGGSKLFLLDSWLYGDDWLLYDTESGSLVRCSDR